MNHQPRCLPKSLLWALAGVSLLCGVASAGVLDQCGVLFDQRDTTARLRRIYPGTTPYTPVKELEARSDYLIVFKLPASYVAQSGRLQAEIKLIPIEGRLDLLQVGDQLFALARSSERGTRPIGFRKVQLTSSGIEIGGELPVKGVSFLTYSETSQASQLPGTESPPPMSAVFDFDLATLESLSGLKWLNINNGVASRSE